MIEIVFLEYFVNQRHQFLVTSIGAMPEEHNAQFQIQMMICISYGTLLLFTIGQVLFYWLFNKKFHPLSEILLEGDLQLF